MVLRHRRRCRLPTQPPGRDRERAPALVELLQRHDLRRLDDVIDEPVNGLIHRFGTRIPVPYDEIVGGATDKDIKLLDKDEIHVPRLEKPRQFTVYGGVRTQGSFPLQGKVTLTQAVGNAGPVEGAKRKEVQLMRLGSDGKYPKKPTKVNVEDGTQASLEIQDGDVLFIPDPSRGNKFDLNQALSTVGSMIWISSLLRR